MKLPENLAPAALQSALERVLEPVAAAGSVQGGSSASEAPKAVLNEQVVAFLKKNCRHCWGQGWVRAWFYVDEDTQIREKRVCKCARLRFMKANKDKIREIGGKLEWIS